jgi:GNAT superfamily N-acetyltransferase
MTTVRRARGEDADELAAVHVAAWNHTYAGLLPEAYLAARGFAARRAFWRDLLRKGDPAVCVFVACDGAGRIVGFASGGPERTGLVERRQELYALYVLSEAQGEGIGRRLVEQVLGVLGPVAVWVLATNPARGFYERLGARYLTERRVMKPDATFIEAAYALG